MLFGQNAVSSADLAHLNHLNLRKIQTLLLQWQDSSFIRDKETGEQWLQDRIRIEEDGTVIYNIHPAQNNSNQSLRKLTYRFSLRAIEKMENHPQTGELVFFCKPGTVLLFEEDYPEPAAMNDQLSIYFFLRKVRNLAGQLQDQLDAYKTNEP